MAVAPSPISPHRSVDVRGRALTMTEEEIRRRAEEAILAMDEVATIGEQGRANRYPQRAPEGTRRRSPLMRLVFLDTKPLGMVANPGKNPDAARCRQWARNLLGAGVRIFIPEICDYECGRKLIHVGSTSGIARLDRLRMGYDYAPITTEVMQLAADL